jgi:NADPH:quinone reductase-like Zn-dependent oxidoreductase
LNHSTGAFADTVIGKAHVSLRLPDTFTFEEGATLGAGLTTNGLALYKSLGLPLPNAPAHTPFPVFVYGGSTATGAQAIQLLKLYVYLAAFPFSKTRRY